MIEFRRAPAPREGEEHRLLAEGASAAFAPSTYDAEAGTVDVIWSTGAEVRRYDWWNDRYYTEALDLKGARMERLNAGGPLLLDHWASIRNIVGSVVPGSAKLESGKGVATLRFDRSSDDGRAAEAKVAAGHVRSVSIGYQIHGTRTEKRADGPDAITVTDFEPFEISLVAVPADAGAGLRSLPAAPTTAPAHPQQEARMDPVVDPSGTLPANPPAAVRAEPAAPRAATMAEINAIAKRAGQDLDWAISMEGRTLDEVRDAAIDAKAATRRPIEQTRTPSGDDPAQIIDAMATAIAVRAMPGAAKHATGERFREFASYRPTDMLMELYSARGETVGPRDRLRLVERAFHTTSDFPLLLEAASNKMLEAGFALAAPSFRLFFGKRNFNDFKGNKFLTAGDFPALEELLEGGEIKRGTISEKRESVTPKTYAKGFAVTRQMMINDDLGAFGDWGTMIGRRVADQENAIAYAVVNTAGGAGPTLSEGAAAVFTTGRGNRSAAGGAIDEAALDVGYKAIQDQTSLDKLKLNLQPRYLLTGTAYRAAALRATTKVAPITTGTVPLYTDLLPISDANIEGNHWYLLADPSAAPVFVYGYVNGQEAPQTRVFDQIPGRDGILVEVIHDFAAGAIGFRGGFFNAGA